MLRATNDSSKNIETRDVKDGKSNMQNTKIEAVTGNTLVVGIDVRSEFHYIRAFEWRGNRVFQKAFYVQQH